MSPRRSDGTHQPGGGGQDVVNRDKLLHSPFSIHRTRENCAPDGARRALAGRRILRPQGGLGAPR
jgi:hypothetical protein